MGENIVFDRSIIRHLEVWAASTNRKPLVLRGARQVGKTTAIRMFGRQFDCFIHLDLEKKADAELFIPGLPVNELLQAVYLARNLVAPQGRILLFIDEIQNSSPAMAMMRYFFEERPDIHVIAAGSLLETMLGHGQISFPVGRVQYLFMYPVTFEEFLGAAGEDAALARFRDLPLPGLAVSRLQELFHLYTMIGGMPEVVATYLASRDITALTSVYQGLLTAYLDDVAKYARNVTMDACLRHAIESAPLEAGSRVKFQGFGNSGYKSREMGETLKTLERAMLIHLVYPTTVLAPPIMPDLKKSPRLQFLDTGLINYAAGLHRYFFRKGDLHGFYQGRLAEHIVGQELLAVDPLRPAGLAFWVRKKRQSNAEVDFLLVHDRYCMPIEVKAGKAGTLRSLHQFIDRAGHDMAVRLYNGPLEKISTVTPAGKPYRLLSLPYCLAGRLHDYLDWLLSDERETLMDS